MAPKKSKGKISKGRQRAIAAPDADANTEPPNVDHEASLDGAAAAVPDPRTNSEPPGVDYEAELNSILDEYDEAQAQIALTHSVRDNTSRNDASPDVSDSELEVSNRFPDIEELNRQMILNQFELRKELNLPPPVMHQDHQPLWDAIVDNQNVLKNLRDGADKIRASWTKNYNAGQRLMDTFKQWPQKVRLSEPGWVHDQEASTFCKRLEFEFRVREAMNNRYKEDREEYVSALRLAESTIDASQALAKEVAIANGIVLISDLEDLGDVCWDRGNEYASQHVVARHEEAFERWHNSRSDGDEREPDETTEEPEEAETPLRGEDYVRFTDVRGVTEQTVTAPEPQNVSLAVPDEEKTDREKSRADSGAGAEGAELDSEDDGGGVALR